MQRTARTVLDGASATAWLEMDGEKKPLVMSDLGCADGCGRQMGAENYAGGCGRRGCKGWLEMGGEKKPLVMSDLGCADGCGRQILRRTAWTAADGVGACNGVAGNGWGEEAAGDERPWQRADGCGRQMGAENCVDGCGRHGCKGVAGNGWGKEVASNERPWLRRRLRTANGCGELRGWLRTAWVQGGGWKWVGERSRL